MRRYPLNLLLLIAVAAAALCAAPVVANAGVRTPLSTSGNTIVDAAGAPVVLQGVNWFGFETGNHAPHGLWVRDYRAMLAQIRQQGFNTIRLPFSLQMVAASTTSGIDYGSGRNAALQGRTPLEVMDEIIAEAGRNDLMVILDNHSTTDDSFTHPLWYGLGGYSEDDWVATWRLLATRYAAAANVVAADLKNEPHGEATWGTGAANDWRRAAERAGAAVQAIAPHWLIVVEGIEGPVAGGQQLDRHWWGGNLEGVRANPVRLPVANRLVYSPHEYGPEVYAQPWFSQPDLAATLADRWQKGFGYIHEAGTAPILVGEFGAKQVDPATVEGQWITQFADYLGARGISWTFWAWNPNSGDTGGVLKDDWTTIQAEKMTLLTALMRRGAQATAAGGAPASGLSATATAVRPRLRIAARTISLRLAGATSGYPLRAKRGSLVHRGRCSVQGGATTCRVRVPAGRWGVELRRAGAVVWQRTLRVHRVAPIATARWVVPTQGRPLLVRFAAASGTTYGITARRGGAAVTGACPVAAGRVVCRLPLATGAAWRVTVQPRRGLSLGAPLVRQITG